MGNFYGASTLDKELQATEENNFSHQRLCSFIVVLLQAKLRYCSFPPVTTTDNVKIDINDEKDEVMVIIHVTLNPSHQRSDFGCAL